MRLHECDRFHATNLLCYFIYLFIDFILFYAPARSAPAAIASTPLIFNFILFYFYLVLFHFVRLHECDRFLAPNLLRYFIYLDFMRLYAALQQRPLPRRQSLK